MVLFLIDATNRMLLEVAGLPNRLIAAYAFEICNHLCIEIMAGQRRTIADDNQFPTSTCQGDVHATGVPPKSQFHLSYSNEQG